MGNWSFNEAVTIMSWQVIYLEMVDVTVEIEIMECAMLVYKSMY
jgi:hypothetical protein